MNRFGGCLFFPRLLTLTFEPESSAHGLFTNRLNI